MTDMDRQRADIAERAVDRWRDKLRTALPPGFNINPTTVADHIIRLTDVADTAEAMKDELGKAVGVGGLLYSLLGQIHMGSPGERDAYARVMEMAATDCPLVVEMAARFDKAAGR